MSQNLPNICAIPKKIDKFLGILDQIKPIDGEDLISILKQKGRSYNFFRTLIKGESGDPGDIGFNGIKGIDGDNAYLKEKNLLSVNSLTDYLQLFSKTYYDNIVIKYSNTFVSYWDTRIIKSNSTYSNQIKIPLKKEGTYDALIFWGDGNIEELVEYKKLTHTYERSGIYKIIIIGKIEGFSFNGEQDTHKLLLISDWGNLTLTDNEGVFRNCSNLKITALNSPIFKNVSGYKEYFANCTNLNNIPNLETWSWNKLNDLTKVKGMFRNTSLSITNFEFLREYDFPLDYNEIINLLFGL